MPAAVVALAVFGAPAAAWAHEHGAGAETAPVTWVAAVTRCVLLVSTAIVAGTALLRPLTGPQSRAHRTAVWVAAVVAIATAMLSISTNNAVAIIAFAQSFVTLIVAWSIQYRWPPVFGGALLAIGLAVEATLGHSGWELAAGIVHVVAASSWAGAVVAVATAGIPKSGTRRGPAPAEASEDGARRGPDSTAAPEGGARRDLIRKLMPWVLVAAVLVVVTGVLQARLDGLGLDERLTGTGFGRVLLLKSLVVVVVAIGGVVALRYAAARWSTVLARTEAVALGVALVAGGSLAVIPAPDPLPVPGAPLLRDVAVAGEQVPVLVTPGKPGVNLVHVGTGEKTSVGTDRAHLTGTAARPGAGSGWAAVTLKPGRATLWVRHDGEVGSVRVDAGHGPAAPAAATGTDGPECASAALGALVAGATGPVRACPGDRLSAADATSLRQLVNSLADRGVPGITLATDSTPRGTAAAALVRKAADDHRLTVHTADPGAKPERKDALVVLSGWNAATTTLARAAGTEMKQAAYGSGTYVGPWLLSAPVLNKLPGVLVPLRYNPKDARPEQYAAALAAAFGTGEAPTTSGYIGWLGARGAAPSAPTQLYAASQVSVMPGMDDMDMGHDEGGWLPGGTVTPVTNPLP